VDLAVWISPSNPALEGSARAAAEVPRQIANANTLFNVINTLLFIGFTGWFARLAERLIPERESPAGVIIEPEFLNEAALKAPSVALQQVRLEVGRMGNIALEMLRDVRPALENADIQRLESIARRDDEVDILDAAVLAYMGRIRQGLLSEQESEEFQVLMSATDNIESLADVVETDIFALAQKAVRIDSPAGEETRQMLVELYELTVKAVELTVQAVRDDDQNAAESVVVLKDSFREQAERLLGRKAERLSPDDPDYIEMVRIQMSFVDQMRRIYTLAKRISKGILPAALAQRD
jgi:phosphate:Na+ symporter